MSPNDASAARRIRCPGCGGTSLYGADNPFRPFCSERCKNHDFGAWAAESYRVAATPQSEGDGDGPLESSADPTAPPH